MWGFGIIGFASVMGLIQSMFLMAFGLTATLVYLGIVCAPPFQTASDFFRVTLVKVYFEGPNFKLDGSYLGNFSTAYRSYISLTHDEVYGLMIVYAIVGAAYFLFSVMLFRARKGLVDQVVALSWGGTTIFLCFMDFVCTTVFFFDFRSLSSVMYKYWSPSVDLQKVPYISLMLALISSKAIVGWVWNVFIGFFIFSDALCCRRIIKRPRKEVKVPEKEKQEPLPPEEVLQPSVSIVNGNYRSQFDIMAHPDFLDYKNSMEAVTRFNTPERPMSVKEQPQRTWTYAPTEAYWHPKSHSSKDWEMVNEAYVNDEPERMIDFDHNLKNFESGQRKIKVVKPPFGKPVSIPVPPPIGKPVSIPVPPPLPPSGSCNC